MMERKGPVKGAFVLLAAVALLSMGSAAQELTLTGPADSVIRGNNFVTMVVGIPVTDYYIWVTGSSSMSGSPEDQPPMLLPGQEEVARDPAGGPYAIGSHVVAGGGTIRGDVPNAPSGGTGYYALVTTDVGGFRTVEWATTQDTATGQYDIRVEGGTAANLVYDEAPVSVIRGTLTLRVDGETVSTYTSGEPVETTTTVTTSPATLTATPTTAAPTPTPTLTPTPVSPPPPTPAPGFEACVAMAGIATAGLVLMPSKRT